MTDCTIEWREMRADEWDSLYALTVCPTLLQSYPYAQAIRKIRQQGVRHGIIHINGVQAGIVQMHEVSILRGMIHGISLDRGPLWFDGFGNAAHMRAFVVALDRLFPKRRGRKRRFMPEWTKNAAVMEDSHWTRVPKIPVYQTHFVDLTGDIAVMRKNLHQKWRNVLNRAERENLDIIQDWNGDSLGALLKNYMTDRLTKKYAGASPKFLSALAQFTVPRQECMILHAAEDGEIIASVLIFLHGRGATYQVGWTTPYGRDKGAHHRLLWEAMIILKTRSVTVLDTGGFNENTGGIKQFKDGLGGHAVALIGNYD